eukprot:Rmarinus@m.10970
MCQNYTRPMDTQPLIIICVAIIVFALPANTATVHVDLAVDTYYSEASWNLRFEDGSLFFASDQTFSAPYEAFEADLELFVGTWYLVRYDSYGDGGISAEISTDGVVVLSVPFYDYAYLHSAAFIAVGGSINSPCYSDNACNNGYCNLATWMCDRYPAGFECVSGEDCASGYCAAASEAGQSSLCADNPCTLSECRACLEDASNVCFWCSNETGAASCVNTQIDDISSCDAIVDIPDMCPVVSCSAESTSCVVTHVAVAVDMYYFEASWNLRFEDGSLFFASNQTFSAPYEAFEADLELSEGTWYLLRNDSYGDGGISATISTDGVVVLSVPAYDYHYSHSAAFVIDVGEGGGRGSGSG